MAWTKQFASLPSFTLNGGVPFSFKGKNVYGQKFSRWTVVGYAGRNAVGDALWLCKCECGIVKTVNARQLLNNRSRSCGCLMKETNAKFLKETRTIDLTNKRFGRLLVISKDEFIKNDSSLRWKCKCDCGNYTVVSSARLVNGRTKSCGCLARELSSERAKKHGKIQKIVWGNKLNYEDAKQYVNEIEEIAELAAAESEQENDNGNA